MIRMLGMFISQINFLIFHITYSVYFIPLSKLKARETSISELEISQLKRILSTYFGILVSAVILVYIQMHVNSARIIKVLNV